MPDGLPKDLREAISKFDQVEKRVSDLWLAIMRADEGRLFPLDLFIQGAIKRTLSQAEGVKLLLENANLVCARSLLRLQIDTAMRLLAASLAPDPHEFARAVLDGIRIDKLKSRNGEKLTDFYLSTELAKRYKWVRRVYERTCGYVHMSKSHFLLTVDPPAGKQSLTLVIAPDDKHMPVASFVEVADCFVAASEIVIEFLEGWLATKGDPEIARWRRTTEEVDEGNGF